MINNEYEMRSCVEKYFLSHGKYSVYYEVVSGRRKIDLIFANRNLSKLISVELKIRDWRGVFYQCLYNQFNSNWCYAAIWCETIPKINKNLFEQYGIGIIEVNEDRASLLLKGKKQNSIDTHSMELIKQKIRENY